MEKISIGEILKATNGTLLSGDTNQTINSVCIDSRKATKNCLFIALKGEKTDGHNFIRNAVDLGAEVCLIEKNYAIDKEIKCCLIEVDSTLEGLQNLATYYRNKFSIPVIGVTGSVGKTTTKEMISVILEETLNVLKTQGNYNGQIGLPLTIFNLDSSHDIAVLEMGISEFGEMDRLRKIANPDVGVITNVGVSHVENFGTVENTCSEKLKIVSGKDKKLYVNFDSPLLSNTQDKTDATVIPFGINGAYPYKCEEIYSSKYETSFVLSTEELKENIIIPCLGIHNVYNALAAISVALDMGIHLEDIKSGLLKFKNVAMRQQILNINDITLIDDSYNASPDSVKSSVSILKNISSDGKNIVVIADMLELGERSQEIHFETGRYIAMEKIDYLITIGENSKYLSEGAKSINQDIFTSHCDNNNKAFEKIKNIIDRGDKILIKGSRGMYTDEIVEKIKNYFGT